MRLKNEYAAPLLCIAVFVMALAVNLIGSDIPGARENPVLTSVVLQLLIFAVPAIFFCRLRPGTCTASYLRLKPLRPDCIMFTVFALAAVLCGSALLRCAVYTLFPSAQSTAAASFSADETNAALGTGYSLLLYAILPALTEEFLFRSVIMGEYLDSGQAAAVLLSSAMFAMAHFSFSLFPVYFFSGIILALTVSVTGSVLASVAVHLANNVLTLFLDSYIRRLTARASNTVIFMVIDAAVLLLALILMFAQAERIFGRRSVLNRPSPEWVVKQNSLRRSNNAAAHPFLTALIAPPFIILAAFCVIVTVAL